MKCAICRGDTNWDESYGYREFIVCPKCFDELSSYNDALSLILIMGRLRKKGNNKKEN